MENRLTIRQYAKKDEDINATLNRIALLAEKEVKECYNGIYDNKYVGKIEAHYIPLIERLANDNWHDINNEVHFIDDCFRRIRYAIKTFDIDRGNFDSRVKWLLYQSVRQYCGSRGKKRDALTLIGDTSVLETLGDCIDNTEEKAIYNVSTYEEIYVKLCEKEADILVLDAMIYVAENYDKVSEKSVSRLLSERTGRSFDFARGVVRGFKQRIRKRNIRKEDIA
ncbi:TPA: hypothetical protein ACLQU7_002512 [Bacillus tropicus]|uniref:Sigma-70 family RNA polymerase sigma factor n=1 Tax=Bacillus tropicus TaxID=2026188 RepID=A0ABD7ZXN1_9BACI|nr:MULTISPECIES: hypothetical protein [Bacillus]AIY77329.1 hypothetical protein NT98_2690 [Bacillus cereus]AJI03056.1 hypothetical protein AQ16_5093 [Bacillus cereus G9241]PED55760.1 hypothetical protein CON50_10625 [Bacillus anthracis]AJG91825.1 hypothetical protein BG03_2253 [Bacillus cereus]ARO18671.1 hypothetical protein B2J90_14800 [Bacillus cereus]